jgi:hypothetical protein
LQLTNVINFNYNDKVSVNFSLAPYCFEDY